VPDRLRGEPPEAQPYTHEELQRFLDCADERVERTARSRRIGALAAYRDATILTTGWSCFPSS
jgi:integrase/recombinase XerC